MESDYTPFGQALLDYHRNPGDQELTVHLDMAETDTLPAGYFFRGEAQMPELELLALDHCRGKILDVGAGAGAHSTVLIGRGFEVTALEQDHGAAEVLRARGIPCVESRFLAYEPEEKYDTLLFLMNGMGVAAQLNRLAPMLEYTKELMAPGAQVLVDSSDLSYMYDGIENTEDYYGDVEYTFEYNGQTGTSFPWLFVDFPMLKKVAESVGFTVEKIKEGPHYDYLAKLTVG